MMGERSGSGYFGWNNERVETMRVLAAQGNTAAQISAGLDHAVTRCAVIGKCNRLGILLGKDDGRPKLATRPATPPAPMPGRPWLPAHYDQLSRLNADGLAIKRIAREMRSTPGTIREKIRVLGLVRYGPPVKSQPVTQAPRPRPTAPAYETGFAPVTIGDLAENLCHWPLWGGAATTEDRFYCGAGQERGSRYCPFHSDLGINLDFRRPRAADGSRLPSPRGATASRLTGRFA